MNLKTNFRILVTMIVLVYLITACNDKNGPNSVLSRASLTYTPMVLSSTIRPQTTKSSSITNTPTILESATVQPTATSSIMATAFPSDVQSLEDIIFFKGLPVEQSLPDDKIIPWNLLIIKDGAVKIFSPGMGIVGEVPHLSEKDSEGISKISYEYHVSPNGKWLAYRDSSRGNLIVEPTGTLLTNKDVDRIEWNKKHWFRLLQWMNNDTVLVLYPKPEEKAFYPTGFLNPFTGEEHVFSLEEMPNYLDNRFGGAIFITHYLNSGELVPDPTMKKLIYPAWGNNAEILNVLWDVETKLPLAQLQFLIGIINNPLWSQDGSDVLLMGPGHTQGEEWFLITADGFVRQITQFKDVFHDASYYIGSPSRSWDGRFLAFEFYYRNPEEHSQYIILDLKTSVLDGYHIPMNYEVSTIQRIPIWAPDSKYLLIMDTDSYSYQGDVILVDVEEKRGYKIAEDMDVIGWIVKP